MGAAKPGVFIVCGLSVRCEAIYILQRKHSRKNEYGVVAIDLLFLGWVAFGVGF